MKNSTVRILSQSDWQEVLGQSINYIGIKEIPLDQFEWVILKVLNQESSFDINTSYDIEQKGRGFKSGKIQLLRDTRDSKIFISCFYVNRPDGTNKLANITLYKYEHKKDQSDNKSKWFFECKIILDNSSERKYPLNKLYEYIRRQLSLDGHKLDSPYAKVIEAISKDELILQSDVLEKIRNLQDTDKLNEIVAAVTSNKNIVLSTENYHKLVQTRYSQINLDRFSEDMHEFRILIDNPETVETDMQKFLGDKKYDRSWFFGLDYIKTYPKFNPGLPCEYDFLARRFNLVFDIVELKSPNSEIIELVKTAARNKPDNRNDYAYSSTFGRALHQVVEYLQIYEQHFDLIQDENPSVIDFNGGRFPRGIIVMSKRSMINNLEDLHKLNRQFSSIDIYTYDDLYDRASNILQFMKNISTIE